MTEGGTIHSGSIVLVEPINLPEGTEVIVHVEPVTPDAACCDVSNACGLLAASSLDVN